MSTENTHCTEKISNPATAFIRKAAQNDGIALIEPSLKGNEWRFNTITYRDFSNQSLNFASMLKEKYGIDNNCKVLILYPFSISLYIAVTALLLLGASIVFIEPWMGRKLFSSLTGELDTKLCITSKKNAFLLRLSGRLRNIRHTQHVSAYKYDTGRFLFREQECGDSPAVMTFSTGSSGTPKPVVRTYSDILSQSDSLGRYISASPNGDLITFPNLVLLNLQRNIPAAIPPSSFKGNSALPADLIENLYSEFGIDRAFMSSTLLTESGGSLNGLSRIYAGGSIVLPEFLSEHNIMHKTTVFYGSTEIEPISVNENIKTDNERGIDAGPPVNGLSISISDPDSENVGEITVTHGKRIIKTGDLGYLSEKGHIVLMGRQHDSPLYKGLRIYPYEIARSNARKGYFKAVIPVLKSGRLIIVVEDTHINNAVTETLKDLHLEPDDIRLFPVIPRDPRHRAKIDYRKLSGLV